MRKATGKDVPLWVLDPSQDIARQFEYAGSTPVYTGVLTGRAKVEENLARVQTSRMYFAQEQEIIKNFKSNPEQFFKEGKAKKVETKEGTQYQLTEEAFKGFGKDFDKRANAYAREQYLNLSSKERAKYAVQSGVLGVQRVVFGAGSMFAGKIEEGEKFSLVSTYKPTEPSRYYSGEFLIPAGVVVYGASTLGATGYSNIKSLGWKAGTLETAQYLSPIRIKSGVYGSKLNENVKLNVEVGKGENFVRKFGVGTTKSGTDVYQYQLQGKTGGQGYKLQTGEYYNVKYGGAVVEKGNFFVGERYAFVPTGSGSAYKFQKVGDISIKGTGIKGGSSNVEILNREVLMVDTSGKYTYGNLPFNNKIYLGGGSYKDLGKGMKYFETGQTTPEITSGKGIFSRPKVIRFSPQTIGTEYQGYQIQPIRGSAGGGKASFSTKGLGQLQTTTMKFGELPVISPPTSTQITTPKVVSSFTATTTNVPSSVISFSLPKFKSPEVKLSPKLKQTLVPSRTIEKPKQDYSQIPSLFEYSSSSTRQIQPPISIPTQPQLQKPQQKQRPIIDFPTKLSPRTGGYDFGEGFSSNFPPIPPFLIGGLGISGSLRRIGTKPKYGYTPDYTSLIKGVKGKQTKGIASGKFAGFEKRPVTKNWIFNLFKKKKKKRSKK